MQKRIAAIHDLSCFGKCSLTVVLPVISCLGVECAVVPTAVLTGHFAALPQVDVLDLTDQMSVLMDHWKQGGLTFDGIFSGYLSSAAQVEQVRRFVREFRGEQTLFFADPAMADRGKLYRGFGTEHVRAMARLCAEADVILPNVTEACLMLDEPWQEVCGRGFAEKLLRGMAELGAKQVVLTGVSTAADRVGIAVFDGKTVCFDDRPKIPGHYNGTGDLFGSVLSASMVKGMPLADAAVRAMDFTAGVIARTAENPHHRPYGVDFEACLHQLRDCQ